MPEWKAALRSRQSNGSGFLALLRQAAAGADEAVQRGNQSAFFANPALLPAHTRITHSWLAPCSICRNAAALPEDNCWLEGNSEVIGKG